MYLCRLDVVLKETNMNTINYTERNLVESYSAVLGNLSVPCKIALMERLLKSLKNESIKTAMATDEFIHEKSAEQIIAELRESRTSGKTRIIEPF